MPLQKPSSTDKKVLVKPLSSESVPGYFIKVAQRAPA